jgi:tellurite resistance protein
MQADEAGGNGSPWDPRDLLQAVAAACELIALVSHEAAAAAAGLMAWALRWVLDQQV